MVHVTKKKISVYGVDGVFKCNTIAFVSKVYPKSKKEPCVSFYKMDKEEYLLDEGHSNVMDLNDLFSAVEQVAKLTD